MATTHVIFQKGKLASTHIDAYLRSVKCATDLDNGNLVRITGLETGEKDLWTASTPTTASITAEEVYIVDEPVRNLIGGSYAIDVQDPREFYVPAGLAARVRKLTVGDTCYVSAAGFSSTPTVGQYAIPANTSLLLAPAASLSGATVVAFKVVATHTFYCGTTSVSGYRLEVVVAP
jgi:hypothetical protein